MENTKIAIIDADSIVWGTAYLENIQPGSFREGLKNWLYDMFNYVGATHYVGIIGQSGEQKRKLLYPTYKATRPPKPDFYLEYGRAVEQHLLTEWDFVHSTEGYEADDDVASIAAACRIQDIPYVVCGIDKDLRQIPGDHYNYKSSVKTVISQENADFYLIKQLLTGDSTDNIGGVPGIGSVKADKILKEAQSNSLIEAVLATFINKFGLRLGLSKFTETYFLVKLKENLPIYLDEIMNKIEYES